MPFSEPQSSRYQWLAAADQQRVVARDGDVVEEHLGVGAPADAHPLALDREALAHAPAAGADHERRARQPSTSSSLDRDELAGLVDPVGRRDGLAAGLGAASQQRAAALAVVGALAVDEAALGAVQRHAALR